MAKMVHILIMVTLNTVTATMGIAQIMMGAHLMGSIFLALGGYLWYERWKEALEYEKELLSKVPDENSLV